MFDGAHMKKPALGATSAGRVPTPHKEIENMLTMMAQATDTVEIEQHDGGGCHLPQVVAPQLAAFHRLADARLVNYGDDTPDPFVTDPCPAWCYTGRESEEEPTEHLVEPTNFRRAHRSRPIRLPLRDLMGQRFGTRVILGNLEVSLWDSATAQGPTTPWVMVTKETRKKDSRDLEVSTAFRATPNEAREIARALLAAADLADPDGEFDAAGL